ncbi:hypothetical protein Lal_00039840 [Lupinus albus]|nr:hypothetical protein Lal_00039840 [Lupinus albus]
MANKEVNTIPPTIVDTSENPPTEPPTITQENEVGRDEDEQKKKFVVWDHFTKLPFTETKGQHKAKCNHCRSTYFCEPNKHGTNSMRKHSKRKHQ